MSKLQESKFVDNCEILKKRFSVSGERRPGLPNSSTSRSSLWHEIFDLCFLHKSSRLRSYVCAYLDTSIRCFEFWYPRFSRTKIFGVVQYR